MITIFSRSKPGDYQISVEVKVLLKNSTQPNRQSRIKKNLKYRKDNILAFSKGFESDTFNTDTGNWSCQYYGRTDSANGDV